MKRLLRILLVTVTAILLLLCMATCVLWVRSYWIEEAVGHTAAVSADLRSSRGRLRVDVIWWEGYADPQERGPLGSVYSRGPDSLAIFDRPPLGVGLRYHWHWDAVGLSMSSHDAAQPVGTAVASACPIWSLTLPHGLLAAFTAIMPIVGTWKWQRGQRTKHGVCPSCGYDLRATPHRCPECGAVPKGVYSRA